ncbi:hypothetical protein BH23BAC4_BH23BAC4_02260 [soil metagenome]
MGTYRNQIRIIKIRTTGAEGRTHKHEVQPTSDLN